MFGVRMASRVRAEEAGTTGRHTKAAERQEGVHRGGQPHPRDLADHQRAFSHTECGVCQDVASLTHPRDHRIIES